MTDESDVVAPLQAAEAATGRPVKPWCYERMFPDVRKNWDEHDQGCESLKWFWPGHPGGVSCLSDMTSCEDCDVTFWNEGVTNVTWNVPDEDSLYLCSCCARKRGYDVCGELEPEVTGLLVSWETFDQDATAVAPSEASPE